MLTKENDLIKFAHNRLKRRLEENEKDSSAKTHYIKLLNEKITQLEAQLEQQATSSKQAVQNHSFIESLKAMINAIYS